MILCGETSIGNRERWGRGRWLKLQTAVREGKVALEHGLEGQQHGLAMQAPQGKSSGGRGNSQCKGLRPVGPGISRGATRGDGFPLGWVVAGCDPAGAASPEHLLRARCGLMSYFTLSTPLGAGLLFPLCRLDTEVRRGEPCAQGQSPRASVQPGSATGPAAESGEVGRAWV